MKIERRITALEKTMEPRGCHFYLIIGDSDEAKRKLAEIKRQDPGEKYILSIIRSKRRTPDAQSSEAH